MSYFLTPWNNNFDEIYASGNIITEQYFIGNGAFLTGATFTPPAVSSSDIRGNVIGSYANVSNIIASAGNIANVRFATDGNVTAAYFIGNGSQLTGVTSTLPSIANIDIRGNVIGSYANVSNIIATAGNVGNTRFLGGNVAVSGQVNVLGNVVASFFIGNGSQLTGVTSTLPSVANIDIRGNIIGAYANMTNIIATAGNIANVRFAADGNVTAAYFFGDGSQLTDVIPADLNVTNLGVVQAINAFEINTDYLSATANVTASYFIGNGSQLTGITSVFPATANVDIRGNIIGAYANMTNIIATAGNIANVRFAVDGNVTAAYFFGNGSQLTNVVASGVQSLDIRGNVIGSYANVSNIIATAGNVGNTRFLGGNVAVSGQVNVLGNVVASFFIGNGSQLTGVTSTLPSTANIDIRGNVIGSYANVSNIIATAGNVGNVNLRGGNIMASGSLMANTATTVNLMNLISTGASYSSSIVNLQTTRAASSLFNFIKSSASGGTEDVFTVNGLGNVGTSGALTIDTGFSYGAAPLANNINSVSTSGTTGGHGHISCVTRGNTVFRVDVGGTITSNIVQNVEVANLYATSVVFTRNVLSLQTLRGNSDAFNFIRCAANDGADTQFSVNGTGGVKSINTNSGAPDVMNVTSLNTNFRGVMFKGYIAAGGYSGQNFISCVNGTSGNVFRVRGDGLVYGGAYSTTGADYAEYFEWEDDNPWNEDRRGHTVVMENAGKIRISVSSDNPYDVFGVVSAMPSVVGDGAENNWVHKYKMDKFGNKVSNVLYFLSNINNETERVRCDADASIEGYVKVTEEEYVTNPEYDQNVSYISRENRKEWVAIGLVGKLRVLPDQKVNPSWRFMRTISSDDGIVHEYLLTSGVNLGVMAELNSLKSELSTIKAHLGI